MGLVVFQGILRGALAGSQFGGGKGQLAAVAVGALAGAWLGGETGKSLDKADKAYAQRTQSGPQQGADGLFVALAVCPTGSKRQCQNRNSGKFHDFHADDLFENSSVLIAADRCNGHSIGASL